MAERHKVDARGAYCPGPLMELIATLKHVEVGDEVEVWSTDKGSVKDIPEWIKKVHQDLVAIDEREGYWSVVVRKAK